MDALLLETTLRRLRDTLASKHGFDDVKHLVVDAPFGEKLLVTTFDLGIMVLLLVNEADGMIDRIALSNTELARGAVNVSAKPFHEIRIPQNDQENAISEAIRTGKLQIVDDWHRLFTPALTAEEARRNQAGASIDCSVVAPLHARNGGALIYSFYQPKQNISEDHLNFIKTYTLLVDALLDETND